MTHGINATAFFADTEAGDNGVADRYGVRSFDLDKKRAVIAASAKYKPASAEGIRAFDAAVNALHFDEETGQPVGLDDARELAQTCVDARDTFQKFLDENASLLAPHAA